MGPLEGVRVPDFTIFQQRPQASLVFADVGVDVIKVEASAFGETPAEIAAATPELGQHTEETLQELDYSRERDVLR